LLTLFPIATCHAAVEPADFYLSPRGSDSWSGTLAEPNADGSDGPFASLERARDAVRELKKSKSGDIVVLLRDGTYALKETVVFGLKDSGSADASITYAAYPGETPRFSSGRAIRRWKKVKASLPGLPAAARGKVFVANVSEHFSTLYDSQGLLPRARTKGFIPLPGSGRDRLHYPKGMLKSWPNVEDVEIVIRPHHAWVVNVLPLVSVDEKKQMAYTSISSTYLMDELEYLEGHDSCWVENVLEGLDQPGEWVLNSKEGKVYLWPRSGSTVVAPRLKEFIRVEGQIDEQGPEDIPVRNLTIRGLTFMHGERETLTRDDKGLQHDWDMHDKATALLRLRGAENCVVEQCHFIHSGGGAIRVDLHGIANRVVGNHIEHIGGTGILLCGYGPGTKDVNHHNLVYNNHIHHVGEVYAHAPAIFVWQSGQNRVANNLIHNTPYSGVIISGVMTDFFGKEGRRELAGTVRWHEIEGKPGKRTKEQIQPFLHSHHNLIEYNDIHHVMEKLGDGNGIYIRGAGPGNIIRRNYIHHLLSPVVMQSAIRTDGGQQDTLIAENLIYKCVSHGIHLKLNNRAENNIIAELIEGVHKGESVPVVFFRLREGPLEGGVIQRNILYLKGDRGKFFDEGKNPRLPPAYAKEADTDNNIYYSPGNSKVARKALEKNRADGIDAKSIIEDPLFVDVEKGDFRFKDDSPAHKLGIVPFDMSKVGLREPKN